MARICGQCGRTFADSQAFCTDDGLALPEPIAMAQTIHKLPTADGGPQTAPHARGTFGPDTAGSAAPAFQIPQLA